MIRNLSVIVLALMALCIAGCRIETPEMRGVVLDAETKKPVPEAWIHARMEIVTRTLGGDVQETLSVDPGHIRSDEKGEFMIPAWHFDPAPIPYGFGTKVKYLSISAETIDDRMGEIVFKGYEEKANKKLVIYVRPWDEILYKKDSYPNLYELFQYSSVEIERDGLNPEKAYAYYLGGLHNYCFYGRLSYELPALKGGCDEWELNYAIVKHERSIKKIEEPKTMDQEIRYARLMRQLGYLFKRKRDYENALKTFEKVHDFSTKRNLKYFIKDYEREIKELQEKIGKR